MAGHETVQYTPMVRDMPLAERPRERLRNFGPGALSNAELIAILLRTGVEGESVLNLSHGLLSRFGGLKGLANATYGELCNHRGVSDAKSCQLMAAMELGRRLVSLNPEDRVEIRSPRDVANLLIAEMSFLEQEHLRIVLLNTKNQVLGIREIYVGNVNSSVVRVSEVLRPAVRDNCPAIIVVHNHPSGDPTPSPEDVQITKQLASAGALLDIEVLDHIVIGHQSFVSMKEKGLGFGQAKGGRAKA